MGSRNVSRRQEEGGSQELKHQRSGPGPPGWGIVGGGGAWEIVSLGGDRDSTEVPAE